MRAPRTWRTVCSWRSLIVRAQESFSSRAKKTSTGVNRSSPYGHNWITRRARIVPTPFYGGFGVCLPFWLDTAFRLRTGRHRLAPPSSGAISSPADADDVEPGKELRQLARGGAHRIDGDIDRNVHRRLQRLDQDARLGACAAAELDELGVRTRELRDVGDVGAKDRHLGARQVVLGQLADGFEQPAALLVVEVFRRDAFLRTRKTS